MDKKIILFILAGSLLLAAAGALLISRAKPPLTQTTASDRLQLTDKEWVKGPDRADLTLVEYGDFQCPACGAYFPVLKDLLSSFPGRLKIVYRHFPLIQAHDKAWFAAKAAEAAGIQGKFWDMHDRLFTDQSLWAKENQAQFRSRLIGYAGSIGLDTQKFTADLDSAATDTLVQEDLASANSLGLRSTPTFFLNGVQLTLPGSLENFKNILEGEAAKITPPPPQTVHMHFDLAVYSDTGGRLDYSDENYMEKDPSIHFHDGNGNIVHIHQTGVTLGQLFASLGTAAPAEAGWYVNGNKMSGLAENYQPQDLDRIVIVSMGIGSELDKNRLDKMVTDIACIYSETCPERGSPPTEECVGGLDTPCE